MSDQTQLPELSDALRTLPVPALSEDFDDRILSALRRPAPWWQCLTWAGVWTPLRPLLLGASGSLAVTLLALHLALSGPVSVPPVSQLPPPDLAAAPQAPLPSLDALLDQPNLRAGSLAAWNGASEEAAPPKSSRPPEPRRRAEVGRRVELTA